MKRSLETEDEGNVDETKKRFPVVGPNKIKPIPPFDLYLKNNPAAYLSSESFDSEQLEHATKKIRLNMTNNNIEKDKIDELIERSEEIGDGPPFFQPLVNLGKDLLRYQRRIAKANTRSMKEENDPEYLTESLLRELANSGSNVRITEADSTQEFRRLDYTAPLVLNIAGVCKEVAASLGQQLPGHVEDEASKPVTLKMLKDNPEGHGLEKRDLEGFSDKAEIVDVQVNFRGKRKRLRAFKGGENILVPCTEKNCSHKELDHNHVSICNKKGLMDKKQLETVWSGGNSLNLNSAPGGGWDVDISNEDVVICEPTFYHEPILDVVRAESHTPQITSVQSLAQHYLQTTLTPLASQLPNPVRRRGPSRSGNRYVPQQQQQQILAHVMPVTSPGRPGILSKTTAQTILNGSNIQPMPVILFPPNNNNKRKSNPKATVVPATCSFIPVSTNPRPPLTLTPTQGPTASQMQKSMNAQTQVLKTAMSIRNPSATLSASAMMSKYPFPIITPTTSSGPIKIDSVYSTSTLSPGPIKIPPKSTTKDLSTVTNGDESEAIGTNGKDDKEETDQSEVRNMSDSGSVLGRDEDDDDDPTTSGTTPTPFVFAKNIFEEVDDEHENEEYNEFDVPQIVSTSGGVQMLPQVIIPPTPAEEERTKQMRLKEARARIATAKEKLKEKAEYPLRQTRGGSNLILCRFCNKSFPENCLRPYRAHLLKNHNIKLSPAIAEADNEYGANGQAGTVTELPPMGKRVRIPAASSLPAEKEFFKCKSCHAVVQANEKGEHFRICPTRIQDLTLDTAYDRHMVGTKPPVVCGLCEKSCMSRAGFRQHLKSSHKESFNKVLIDPELRCASCLNRYNDTVHLTHHAQNCKNRRASAETMLELAQGMIYCEVCAADHADLQTTQTCYTEAMIIRCVICLHVVISRGNFFHHMKTFHNRGDVGIHCPFCDSGEIPIKDCFVHILESHYAPILLYNSQLEGAGVPSTSKYRLCQSDEHVMAFQRKLLDASKARLREQTESSESRPSTPNGSPGKQKQQQPLVTSTLVIQSPPKAQGQQKVLRTLLPAETPTQVNPIPPPLNGPRIVSLRTLSPAQLGGTRPTFAIRTTTNQTQSIQIRPGQVVSATVGGVTSPGVRAIRHVYVGGNQATIRPIQFAGGNPILRQIRPLSPGTASQMGTGARVISALNVRSIRPMTPISVAQAIGPMSTYSRSPLRQLRPAGMPMSTTASGLVSIVRQIRPGSPGGLGAPTSVVVSTAPRTPLTSGTGGVVRTLRPIRPALPIAPQQVTSGPNASVGGIPRGGTIQAITPAQLQLRPGQVIQGGVGPAPRVNFTNAASLNLLKK